MKPNKISGKLVAALGASLIATGCAAGPRSVGMFPDLSADGTVNELDVAGSVSPTKGTLPPKPVVLVNNDSDARSGEPDWSDDLINGEADLEDLTLVLVDPVMNIPDDALITLKANPEALPHVRVFKAASADAGPGDYVNVPLNDRGHITPADLAAGFVLRVEAKSFAQRGWDGSISLTLEATKGDKEKVVAIGGVELKASPWIMLSGLAPARQFFVREYPGRNDTLLAQLRQIIPTANSKLVVVPEESISGYRPNHIWMQDVMEIGYTETVGRRMNVVLKAHRNKSLDAYPKEGLLGPDFGWFEIGQYRPEFGVGDGGDSWLDWYGNLEATPPLPNYPLGRVYYGVSGNNSLNPEIVDMINAQGVQGPALGLDVGWLMIRHVDEMILFLPTGKADRPYKLAYPSFVEFEKTMKAAQAAGAGESKVFDRFHDYWKQTYTVNSLLANEELMQHNRQLEETRIKPMLKVALEGFGLTEADLLPIPALHAKDGGAICPNMVNAALVNGHLIVSDPNGPIINGKDPLQERLRELLADLPVTIHFVDDRQYHKWSGNSHCATNATRDGFEQPYWELLK